MNQTQLDHIRRTVGNKLWRMTHLYKIVDKTTRRLQLLKPNPIQLSMYEETRGRTLDDFFLKYRQGGVSTWWLIDCLDDAIFNENFNSGIQSHEKESLTHLWTIVKFAYDNMPVEYKPKSGKYNESTITFPEINSQIFVSLSIRSTRVDRLHISEACFIDGRDIKASLAAVAPGGGVTVESTANGVGNDGYFMYMDAKLGKSSTKAHFYPWWIQPEYRIPLNGMAPPTRTPEEAKLPLDDEQVLYRRKVRQQQGYLADQEMAESDETCFLTTGNPYFNNQKVMALLTEARDFNKENQPAEETHELTMWDRPIKGHVYAAGADVAEGLGGDYSVLKIVDVTARREVFRYRAHVGVDTFYAVCDTYGRMFFNALLAVERNNHGHAVLLGLKDVKHYPNLYAQRMETRLITRHGRRQETKIIKIGWDTTDESKAVMLSHLQEAIEGDPQEDVETFHPEIVWRDETLMQEALMLRNENGKIGASEGQHDDDVMASAIAHQMYRILKRSSAARGKDFGIIGGQNMEALTVL